MCFFSRDRSWNRSSNGKRKDTKTGWGKVQKNKRWRPTAVFAPAAARLRWRTDPDLPRRISCVATREVRCGNTRCLLWQDKTSVVARDKGGGRLRWPPPIMVTLSLATTEVLSCNSRHLVLRQRTPRLAAHISSQRRVMSRFVFSHNSTLVAPFGASIGAN